MMSKILQCTGLLLSFLFISLYIPDITPLGRYLGDPEWQGWLAGCPS